MKSTPLTSKTSLFLGLTCLGFIVASTHASDMVEDLDENGYTEMSDLIDEADLSFSGRILTLFAPTDAAFAALPPRAIDYLLLPKNEDLLESILQYHVSDTTINRGSALDPDIIPIRAGNFGKFDSLDTLNGQPISLAEVDGQFYLDGYSLVSDPNSFESSDDVVHGIDAVLLPSGVVIPEILDLDLMLINNGFTTFAAAIVVAGLEETLFGSEVPLTVFAPSNEAFEDLPEGVLDALLLPENVDTLTQIILFHVTSEGELLYEDLKGDSGIILSLAPGLGHTAGEKYCSTSSSEDEDGDCGLYLRDALVEDEDHLYLDGVVHGIDRVMLPPGLSLDF